MLYGVPLGCHFSDEVVKGFLARYPDPLDIAKVTIIANSQGFGQSLAAAFARRTILRPQILTLDELLVKFTPFQEVNFSAHKFEVLKLAQLLAALHKQFKNGTTNGELFRLSDRFEIAYSLLELLDQIVERELHPSKLLELELGEFAAHWQVNAEFFQILVRYWESAKLQSPIYHALSRLETLERHWQTHPPADPIYIVGSTGSRPIMRKLMRIIFELASSEGRGGIIVPSVDFSIEAPPLDHAQYGVKSLATFLECQEIMCWSGEENPIGEFVAAALAPAPVTDLWRDQIKLLGFKLSQLSGHMTIVHARNRFEEARAIFVKIYQAVSEGKSVTIATPDRLLVREVSHWLRQYQIPYSDSSALPMAQTPLALLAAQILQYAEAPNVQKLFEILHHELVKNVDEKSHHDALIDLDKKVLRHAIGLDPLVYAKKHELRVYDFLTNWMERLRPANANSQAMHDWADWHLATITELTGPLEEKEQTLISSLNELREMTDNTAISFNDYCQYWRVWLAHAPSQQNAYSKSAKVRFLGTIEVRAESSDVLIQAGLNEGSWPDAANKEIWLNRALRRQLGLEVPERFVGLSAHDFISGIAAKEWIMTRALEEDGAATVESRFVTRLRTLMQGADEHEYEAVMQRGSKLCNDARGLVIPSKEVAPVRRPAILLGADERPMKFSATKLESYVKNPYSRFVSEVLELRDYPKPSDMLDGRISGILWHDVFETLTKNYPNGEISRDNFEEILIEKLDEAGMSHISRLDFEKDFQGIAETFIDEENERRKWASIIHSEKLHEIEVSIDQHNFTFGAKIDRIDISQAGEWRLFDYKSGRNSYGEGIQTSHAQQFHLGAYILSRLEYGDKCEKIGVICYKKNDKKSVTSAYNDKIFSDELMKAMRAYVDPARAWHINPNADYADAINHFARHGEWLSGDDPEIEELHL